MGLKTMYDFWSNWPPKLTLEVVPLKCVSRQRKTPLRVPIANDWSSKRHWMWEKDEAQLQQSKSCQGKIGESSVHADTLLP